jgi:hypothetical protein
LITYVGIHRGSLAGEAELIALSAEPGLVGDVAARLLRGEQPEPPGFDPILGLKREARRRALRAICAEARRSQGRPINPEGC